LDLWYSRDAGLKVLRSEYSQVIVVLDDLFSVVADIACVLHNVDSPLGRVSALVIVKARNLALGCYSLSLDSLAQEGGALFRPLLECLELLEYFRQDPNRVDEAAEGRLPSAGVIAKRIDGDCKKVREYLNQHASHLSIAPESMHHILDFASRARQADLCVDQCFSISIAVRNLQTLFAVFCMIAIEGANCLFFAGDRGEMQADLSDRVLEIRMRGLKCFEEVVEKLEA